MLSHINTSTVTLIHSISVITMFKYCFAVLLLVTAANSAILGKDDPLLGIAQEYAGKSCAHIYDNNLATRNKSGLYWVKLTTNEIVQVKTIENSTYKLSYK